ERARRQPGHRDRRDRHAPARRRGRRGRRWLRRLVVGEPDVGEGVPRGRARAGARARRRDRRHRPRALHRADLRPRRGLDRCRVPA
ncbi:MAG: hypothetical protein AVDCRST_MAG54-5049, partial [uncultured Actinomycetospora sp.]